MLEVTSSFEPVVADPKSFFVFFCRVEYSICAGDVFLMCRILLKFFAKQPIYDFRSSISLIESSLDCSWRGFVCMLRYFWSHCRALVNAFLLSFSICAGDVFLTCRILLKFFAKQPIYDFRSPISLIESSLDCSWRGFVCMLRYFWSHC